MAAILTELRLERRSLVLADLELGGDLLSRGDPTMAQIGLMGGEVADAVRLPGMGRERPELGQTIQLEVGGVRGPGQGEAEPRRGPCCPLDRMLSSSHATTPTHAGCPRCSV